MTDITYEFQTACTAVATGPAEAWTVHVDRLRTLDLTGKMPLSAYLLLEITGHARLAQVDEAKAAAVRYRQAGGDPAQLERMLRACPEMSATRFSSFVAELARDSAPRPSNSRGPSTARSQGTGFGSSADSLQSVVPGQPSRRLSMCAFFFSLSSYLGCALTALVFVMLGVFIGATGSQADSASMYALLMTTGLGACAVWLLAFCLALTGLILGIIGTVRGGRGRGFAIAGLVMGAVFLLLCGLYFFAVLLAL